ncbi:hypothetical protein [uncultured Neisseria sp.]|jgi:hypothetical protein|uniref:hypothetical protein n=1 Tax=uncultured Neisseria sp. TaxID=237778 RepID=UPI0025CE2D45|nr:hypothetical protein [uncultured Neisseria sp.]
MYSQDKVHLQAELDALLKGVWHDRLQPKALILNYLVMKKFNIIRLPTYFDRTFTFDDDRQNISEILDVIDGYNDDLLKKLESQLDVAYHKTQSILKEKYPNEIVKLYRAICPLGTIDTGLNTYPNRKVDDVTLLPAYLSLLDDKELVPLEIDTLSGWSEYDANQRYGSIVLCREWNIKDILLVADYLDKEGREIGPLESNEWLCINRDKRGIINFSKRDIGLANLYQFLNSDPSAMGKEAEEYKRALESKLQINHLRRDENKLKDDLRTEYSSLIRKRKLYFDPIISSNFFRYRSGKKGLLSFHLKEIFKILFKK